MSKKVKISFLLGFSDGRDVPLALSVEKIKKIEKKFFPIFWSPAPASPSPSGGCSSGQGSKFQNRLDGAISVVLSYTTVPHMAQQPPLSGLHDGCYSFRGGLSFNYAAVCRWFACKLWKNSNCPKFNLLPLQCENLNKPSQIHLDCNSLVPNNIFRVTDIEVNTFSKKYLYRILSER